MRIIDRYLTRQYLLSLGYCFLFLLIIFIILDLFNNLSEFLRRGVTLNVVFSYYFYLLPSLLVQMAPPACLIGLIYALGNFNKNHEIIALKTGGVGITQIIFPYIFIGILISAFLFAAGETLVPKSKITSKAIMEGLILKGKKDLKERSISNLTYYGQNHRMIYAREYEVTTKTLYDVVIFEDNPSEAIQIKITAKKAHYDEGHWELYDSLRQILNRRGDIAGEPIFESRCRIEMPEKPEDFLKEASQVDLMSSAELVNYIGNLRGTSQKLIQRLWIDFHYRIAFSFTALIVILIGAPLAVQGVRQNTMSGMGTGLAVIVIYYMLQSVSLALGKGGLLPPLLSAWMANIILGSYGIYLIRKSA